MQQSWGRVKLTEVNPHLVCVLCHGYFIDATTMAECPHSFCRSCIVLYLETKSYCPICEVQIHKTKPHLNLKPDKTLQDIVYKLVPGLFHAEMRRRREFYAKNPNRDLYLSPEARGVGVERIIYSPDDNISLSLEYYDERLAVKDDPAKHDLKGEMLDTSDREREEWSSTKPGASTTIATNELPVKPQKAPVSTDGLKRYLQCPAVVTMSHLKKFLRLKYGLSQACTVEILYRRESLPDSYSLMDIAYIYTWKRNGPMRFYYRFHMPTPLREILPTLKPSSEPIVDTTPPRNIKLRSPELLDAVGLRPKPPEEIVREPIPKIKIRLDEEKGDGKLTVTEMPKKEEERPKIGPVEDSAVSLLLALSNGHAAHPAEKTQPEVKTENKSKELEAVRTPGPPPPLTPTNGGVFKVPQSMTKRFVFNGGKLMAVKSKQSAKQGKTGEKSKVNGKLTNGMPHLDRLRDPLNLGNGEFPSKSGSLPPGSPRPPPNSEKILKTRYMPPSGLLLNRLTPEVTLSENKTPPEPPMGFCKFPPGQAKQNQPQMKSNAVSKTSKTNGQPNHRKEINRLEQIVNCIKKESSQKLASESKTCQVRNDADGVKRGGLLNGNGKDKCEGDARAPSGDSSIQATDHVAANPSKPDQVDIAERKDSEDSILKRKLNEPSYNRRPLPLGSPFSDSQNGIGDSKKRRLVTPDVSIELMANPAKEKLHKDKKRPPSEFTTLTKRFVSDIERLKKDSEIKINKLDNMCSSMIKIEKVPAPTSQAASSPKPSSTGKTIDREAESKTIEGNDFSSENDQLFIDIRNKCEALKRKSPEPVSIAIEKAAEDTTPKVTTSSNEEKEEVALKESEVPTSSSSETPPKPSGTHKKLPRLIEINAPPRPKLPTLTPDSRQKTGIKMTTVRKEVPLVRKDSNGALDLSSGLSPPSGNPKNGSKSPFHRTTDKSPSSPSSLSSLMALSPFPAPDSSKSPPIRIPTIKPKSSPTPRPSSLSSSSPSPPADRSPTDMFPAYQQLYRQQMDLQSRFLASQANNNWSRETAKKLEEWVRNMMHLPHHPLMFPSQLSPDSSRK